MVYLGVDLHRKVSHVVALDGAGATILSRRFEHSRDAFRRVFGELAPEPISVAFEATYGWGWFADLLADAGIEAHMAHPLATKAIGAGRVKNDAVDAATLAHLLRTNLLPEAWIAPPEVREFRRLVRMRESACRCPTFRTEGSRAAGRPRSPSDLRIPPGRATQGGRHPANGATGESRRHSAPPPPGCRAAAAPAASPFVGGTTCSRTRIHGHQRSARFSSIGSGRSSPIARS